METRKLYRSDRDRMLGGVCSGLGEYFHIDPTLVRLAFVLLTLAGLHGVWIYIILLIIMPLEPQPVVVPPPTVFPSTGA
jgi:phage shock protein C